MKKFLSFVLAAALVCTALPVSAYADGEESFRETAERVNDFWITNHKNPTGYSWDEAAYYTGDMELYFLTGEEEYLEYARKWAEKNNWKGHTENNIDKWNNSTVYHADNQTCFQVYIDLYNILGGEEKIARAKEITDAQMNTGSDSFWWWCDALYMAMPVYSKLYLLTGEERYLSSLHSFFSYAKERLYDTEEHLFFRDGGYVKSTINGRKNIWARGTGWVMAALAKVLSDLPEGCEGYDDYKETFLQMAEACRRCVKDDGEGRLFFTQSVLADYPLSAENPQGYETSGTAFIAFAIWRGINAGILGEEYVPFAEGMTRYIREIAVQESGYVGYVQPIGAAATTATTSANTQNFGVGAVIMALCEAERFRNGAGEDVLPYLNYKTLGSAAFKIGCTNMYALGSVRAIDGAAYISGERTYIPLRAAAEALGASVLWDEAARSVTVSANGRSETFYVGSGAEIRGDRTYVPLRAAAEALGKNVSWNAEENIALIGPRENVFYACDGGAVKLLAQILATGEIPPRPEHEKKDFTVHVEEFENEARIRIQSASAVEVQPENGAKNAFDDDLETRWAGEGDPQIVFDLGNAQYVEKIAVSCWQYATRSTRYELEVSADGEIYDKVFDGSSVQGAAFTYTDVGKNVRYIRLTGHGNTQNTWTSILEVVPFAK